MLRTEGRAAGTWQAGWTIWARSPFWILDCRFWIRHLAGRLDDLGPLEAGKFDWADGPEGGSEFLALHLSGDTRIDHDDRRCVARSSFLLNQGRDFMKFALPVFSAFVVSATLAAVPAQTRAEDRAVPSPAAVWPDWERPECAT